MFEWWEKRKVRRAFKGYISPGRIKEIMESPESLRLSGEEKELTVLFSSIRGFTTIAENLSPTALVDLLNGYLTEMTDVIFRYEGILDKYIGDAIMAFWGAPRPQDDHAVRACRAALEMQQALTKLQNSWEKEGRPRIEMGVGINTGTMYVGNVGSNRRFNFTVMGANVNLAARLEKTSAAFGAHLLMGENTFEAVRKEMLARELDIVRVKGRVQPVRLFELLGTVADADQHGDRIDRFGRGLQAYREQKWAAALEVFEGLASDYPQDGPTRVFIKRCQGFLLQPPEQG